MIPRCYIAPAFACVILSGCMFKAVTVSTRYFTLTPISPSEPARLDSNRGGEQLSVGIGFVKMPSYLLRSSMIIRNGPEIEYLEGAVWSERLDESFQRDLGANLAGLLPSDSIYLTDWAHDQVTVVVHISVQQFDVDINGHGTLIAQWRLTAAGSDVPLKSGRTRLDRTGPSPRGKPEVIAETLSDLTAQFSRALAQSIREARRS